MGLSVATRVDALEARGRLLEAIDLLRAGCEADDVEAAQRLLQLRRAAFDRLPRDTASTRWPPTTADPFPGLTGPPELSADEVNADTVGGSILHHGSLIVRGFAEPAVAAELADGIERTFVAIDAWREAGRKRDATSQWFTPFVDKPAMREWVRAGGGVWAVESPIVAERIFDMYRTIGMRDILAAYFSEAPAVSCEKLTLRKVGPDAVPSWHQDGSFMGDAVRSVNVWIALTDCGGDAPVPGLEILPRRVDELLETGTFGSMFPNSIGHALVERVANTDGIVRPAFRAGDALLFDDRLVHRSAVSDGMTGYRYAVESWFFSASKFPTDYQGLAF
jgi:Phytanoyl-CoA dioxygenase (PhyH)